MTNAKTLVLTVMLIPVNIGYVTRLDCYMLIWSPFVHFDYYAHNISWIWKRY